MTKSYYHYVASSLQQWEQCLEENLLILGWIDCDLSSISRNDIRDAIYRQYEECIPKLSRNHKKTAYLIDVYEDIKIGDIIIARDSTNRSTHRLLGWGEVYSDYIYDESRVKKHTRKVLWNPLHVNCESSDTMTFDGGTKKVSQEALHEVDDQIRNALRRMIPNLP